MLHGLAGHGVPAGPGRRPAVAATPVRGRDEAGDRQRTRPRERRTRPTRPASSRTWPQVTRIQADLRRNDLATAKQDWLTAQLDWERVGASYDSFGNLGLAVDGLPDGSPDGVNDKDFTGLHRLEYGLWHDQSAATLLPVAATLASNVAVVQQNLTSATWPATPEPADPHARNPRGRAARPPVRD